MNILHLINYAGLGGSEHYVLNLLESQSKKNSCHLVYGIDGGLLNIIKNHKIKTKQMNMKHPFDFMAVNKLSDYCKANKIDVIHCHYPRENCIAAFVKKRNPKIKLIYTAHLNEPCGKLWKKLNSFAAKYDNKIISVCNAQIPQLVENGFPKEKIKVIYNGVPTNEYSDKTKIKAQEELRAEFSIPKHVPIICSVTRFEPIKGVPFLVRAMAHYTKIEPIEAKLIIVGNGSQFDEIKEMIRSMRLEKYIICTGYREDADRIAAGADIYINSSESEAMSLALLNAGANGAACIATNVGGNADLLSDDCGILVEYGDTEELARAIDVLVCKDELRNEYSKKIRKKILNGFTVDKMLSETLKLYK